MSIGFTVQEFQALGLDEPEIPCEFDLFGGCHTGADWMAKGCGDRTHVALCDAHLKYLDGFWQSQPGNCSCGRRLSVLHYRLSKI